MTATERTVLAYALVFLLVFLKTSVKNRLLNRVQGYVPLPFIDVYIYNSLPLYYDSSARYASGGKDSLLSGLVLSGSQKVPRFGMLSVVKRGEVSLRSRFIHVV